MLDHGARTQAWLADLAAILAESETLHVPARRAQRKRHHKLRPLWEE